MFRIVVDIVAKAATLTPRDGLVAQFLSGIHSVKGCGQRLMPRDFDRLIFRVQVRAAGLNRFRPLGMVPPL